MSGSTHDRYPGVEQAARSFDAELHTQAYAQTHSDAVQLAGLSSCTSGPWAVTCWLTIIWNSSSTTACAL